MTSFDVTPGLTLAPWRAVDRDAWMALNGDPDVVRYVGDGEVDAEADARLYERILELVTGPEERFAFVLAAHVDGAVVGHLELKTTDHCADDEWEVVYILARTAWGRGLGTALATWARDTAHAHGRRMLATVHPDNTPSLHILRRLGLTDETRLHDSDGVTLLLREPRPETGA